MLYIINIRQNELCSNVSIDPAFVHLYHAKVAGSAASTCSSLSSVFSCVLLCFLLRHPPDEAPSSSPSLPGFLVDMESPVRVQDNGIQAFREVQLSRQNKVLCIFVWLRSLGLLQAPHSGWNLREQSSIFPSVLSLPFVFFFWHFSSMCLGSEALKL